MLFEALSCLFKVRPKNKKKLSENTELNSDKLVVVPKSGTRFTYMEAIRINKKNKSKRTNT